jgi:hypothetical protein
VDIVDILRETDFDLEKGERVEFEEEEKEYVSAASSYLAMRV